MSLHDIHIPSLPLEMTLTRRCFRLLSFGFWKSIGIIHCTTLARDLFMDESFFVRESSGFVFPGIHFIEDTFFVSNSYRMTLKSALTDFSVDPWQVVKESHRSLESTHTCSFVSMFNRVKNDAVRSFPSSIATPVAMVSAEPIDL